jgi:molybdopterin converting factor small subunit
MPTVKVKYFAFLRELLDNVREEEYEVANGVTLMDLILNYIPQRHLDVSRKWKEKIFETKRHKVKLDDTGTPRLRGYYLVLINGRQFSSISQGGRHRGFRYRLKDRDEIAILPPVGGG